VVATLALWDKLAALVVDGPKRATTTLLRDFETGREPVFPEPACLWLVVDGGFPAALRDSARPPSRCANSTRSTPRFAWDEGEGDRSLAWWRDAHLRYFGRLAAGGALLLRRTDEGRARTLRRRLSGRRSRV
jgi:uncharacterized protein YhfF